MGAASRAHRRCCFDQSPRKRQLLDSAPATVVSGAPFDIAAPMARDL
ncbi:hypothetical protein [Kitasatospora sp. NPDC006786]